MSTNPVIPNQQNQEAAAGSPAQQPDPMLGQYGEKLLQLANKIRSRWEWKRRGIVLKILKNKEMKKGNQFTGFYPGTLEAFDGMQEYRNSTDASNKNGADLSMDRRPHNFYQMLNNAFVAALSASVPKLRGLPANADVEEDREMAKAFNRIETIIENANKIKGLVKQELDELFNAGAYFKFTRYVVDPDRTGTHKETQVAMAQGEVLPARYVCYSCGQTTPESEVVGQKSLACPNCGSPFSGENYFEDHVEQVPVAQDQTEVANGMVLWNVYSGIHVDADPDVPDLLNTTLLNVSEEVSLGWLRATFPQLWKQFEQGQTSGAANEQLERQLRDMLTTPAGYGYFFGYGSQSKPTYSRTWFQPTAFAEMDNQTDAEALMKAFPQGCMLMSVGSIPLQIREAKLTKEWSWCGSMKGYGLFPPPVGDPAIPIQERINDCIAKIDEYMDRLACGILLANSRYVDVKQMNGKMILPGILNPIAFKQNAPPGAIADAIFQMKAEIDQQIFNYVATLKQDMELLVGTPPQTFGAGTQQGVETMGGQEQQLNTGMMKMGLVWDNLREEHAEAGENAVVCAAKNMTEDWKSVVTDETEEFRNEYVHLDQMKGSIHVEPESDQGFPMTQAEIKSFWQDLLQSSDKQLVQWLMTEPENVDNALRYIGVPGLVAPGASMRSKMLRIIEQLVASAAVEQPDPMTGQPVQVPSIQPNKYLDDLEASQKMIENWSQDHWDKLETNQQGLDNLIAYYKMTVVYQHEKAAEMQMAQAAGAPQPQGAQA